VITVIGGDIVGNHRIRLELVGNSPGGTRSSGFIDIGTIRVESEPVGLSQTCTRLEWGRDVICVESEDWVGEGGKQGISKGGMRQRWIA